MNQKQVENHLKSLNNSNVNNFQKFKKLWYDEILIIAQNAVEDDAELLFYFMGHIGNNSLWVKIKTFFKKLFNKKFRTNRLDWYAVYFIVDMIAKVNEQLKNGANPTVTINRVLEAIGNPSYYDNFPNKDCQEVKMYKLLAIKLYEGLNVLNSLNDSS